MHARYTVLEVQEGRFAYDVLEGQSGSFQLAVISDHGWINAPISPAMASTIQAGSHVTITGRLHFDVLHQFGPPTGDYFAYRTITWHGIRFILAFRIVDPEFTFEH